MTVELNTYPINPSYHITDWLLTINIIHCEVFSKITKYHSAMKQTRTSLVFHQSNLHVMSHDFKGLKMNHGSPQSDWTSAISWHRWRCSAVSKKTVCKCFPASILVLTSDLFFVNVLTEMNVNISNEHNFPDVYQSANYIGSPAKFAWTPSGFIHFAHDPM